VSGFPDNTLSVMKSIIESVSDGIYLADLNGFYLMANAAFERISGINRKELAGKHTNYAIEKNWVPRAVNLEVLKDHKSRSRLVRYPSGRDLLVTAAIVWDRDRNPLAVVSSLRDVTELSTISRELEKSQVLIEQFKKRIDYLEEQLGNTNKFFVARSTEFRQILAIARKVASSDATVLITGDSGVGKDVLAQFIHFHSPRHRLGSFVKVDCAALPPTLLESELFGYEKGAFTDARSQGKQGLFELAQGGTLFLDEIGEFPLELQPKLLNVLQDRSLKRLGGLASQPIDVRIIAATNMDLERMVKERKFRKDLYYRLNVIPLHISPLRERREDILPLVRHFLTIYNRRYQADKALSMDALNAIVQHDWPGNVREVRNAIERIVVTSEGHVIALEDLPREIRSAGGRPSASKAEGPLPGGQTGPLRKQVEEFERALIRRTLRKCGNLNDAARELQIDLSTLTRKNRKYGLTGAVKAG
jgi:PAS domain S-box-containing protein